MGSATFPGVPTTRSVGTTADLTGGGDLSANRILGLADTPADASGTFITNNYNITINRKGQITSSGGFSGALPLFAGFTLLNGAAGTNPCSFQAYSNGLSITQNATPGASGQVRFARHDTPGVGQAFTVTARLGSIDPQQAYAQAQQGSLILRNSANGRMILFGNGGSDATAYVQIFSGYASGQVGQYTAFSVAYNFPYKRIVSDGTNLTFFISKDGIYWIPAAAGTTIANYLGALDEVGFGLQSIPAIATLHGTICQSYTFV